MLFCGFSRFVSILSFPWVLFQRYVCVPLILCMFRRLLLSSESVADPLQIYFPSIGISQSLGGIPELSNGKRSKCVRLRVLRPFLFLIHVLLDFKLGLAESYMRGAWEAEPSPKEFICLLIRAKRSRGQQQKTKASNGFGLLATLHSFLGPRHHPNTPTKSRRNVEAHYDLGNELFAMFLDPSMTYSCAQFEDLSAAKVKLAPPVTATSEELLKMLHEAQMKKYDNILDTLGHIGVGTRVLEIGCGWGAFGTRAVRRFGCRWTGLTLSTEQLRQAREKVEEGNEGKVELKLLDYRMEKGLYDHVVAIEMIEAVGHECLPTFFATCNERLKPGGKLCLQAILCRDECYERYRHSTDFIRKHIFPGGHLPSLGAIRASLPRGLQIVQMHRMDAHYAATLDIWRELWIRNRARAMELTGPSPDFFRKWDIYLSLCSALFENSSIYLARLVMVKRFENESMAELEDD